MDKIKLVSSLKKSFLDLKGIDDYYIFCKSYGEKSQLNMRSCHVAFNSTVFSEVNMITSNLGSQEFIIREPKKLLNIINIFSNELNFNILNNTINIKDSEFNSTFILCDPSSINISLPQIDEPEHFDMKINLENGFIERFFKAKKANNSEIFTVSHIGENSNFEIGDINVFSNKISFSSKEDVEFRTHSMDNISFSSNIVEEIFERNKEMPGYIEIFRDGLMKLEFNSDHIKSKYFLVALDII